MFRALAEIDTEKLLAAWFEAHPEQGPASVIHNRVGGGKFKANEFLASLAPMMERIDAWEMHLGDYGDVNRFDVQRMDAL